MARNDEGGSSSISDFVKWCVGDGKEDRGHTADNYALIFSGHGDGFLSGKFLRDDHPGSYLTGPGLRKELRKVKEILHDEKLKIIGFDSCVMNSVETAYEMSPFAEILVGSQGYFPNAGWDYGRIATNICKVSDSSPQAKIPRDEMADIFTDSLIESNYRYALYAGRSIDINWSDLSKIDSVADATYSLANTLTEIFANGSLNGKVEQAILMAHWKCQTFFYDQCVDLIDFCEILKNNCDKEMESIAKSCQDVIDSVETCVKRSLFVGPEFQFARGLSLFFPWSYDTYKNYFEKIYTKLDIATGNQHIGDEHTFDKSKWAAFLEQYLKQTKRDINNRANNPIQDLKDLEFLSISGTRSVRGEATSGNPITPFFAPLEWQNRAFVFNAHRIGGGDKPRIGGGDRPRGEVVPEETRITKNLPWVWNEWGLSDEAKTILLEAGIIDESGKPSGFIPA